MRLRNNTSETSNHNLIYSFGSDLSASEVDPDIISYEQAKPTNEMMTPNPMKNRFIHKTVKLYVRIADYLK